MVTYSKQAQQDIVNMVNMPLLTSATNAQHGL